MVSSFFFFGETLDLAASLLSHHYLPALLSLDSITVTSAPLNLNHDATALPLDSSLLDDSTLDLSGEKEGEEKGR